MTHVLAIDIGGTKIATALVDEKGQLTSQQRGPTPLQGGCEAILKRVLALARETIAGSPGTPPRAVGVGTGGQVDPRDGHIIHATPLLPDWTGLYLRTWLQRELGLPAAVANDVHAMGLGEATHGAGRAFQHLLCLAVGTGIGGAFLVNGQLVLGGQGGAGHYGHVSIDALNGRRCTCGGIGCVEAYAAGPAIVSDWTQAIGPDKVRQWTGKAPDGIGVEDIAALLKKDDEAAETADTALHRAGWYVGLALTSLIHAMNPDVVVVGGGVAQAGDPFFSGMREAVEERAIESFRGTLILPAALGPEAGLVGAGVLARQLL